MSLPNIRVIVACLCAVSALELYGAAPSDSAAATYEKAKTLNDAVAVLHDQLDAVNKKQYIPLLTDASIKAAIDISLGGHERDYAMRLKRAENDDQRASVQREVDRFLNVLKPAFEAISKDGKWPAGTFFLVRPTRKDVANVYVTLQVTVKKDRAAHETPVRYGARPRNSRDYGMSA
jgi:hypothetical protein